MPASQNPFRLTWHDDTSGVAGSLGRFADRLLERLSGLHWLARNYELLRRENEEPGKDGSGPFAARVLARMGVQWSLAHGSLETIPRTGSTIIVSNHPYGGLEGLVLFDLLSRIRKDVRVLANYLLLRIEELREQTIAVDPFDEKNERQRKMQNVIASRQAMQWLKDGGLLAMFPAGTVSHRRQWGSPITDSPWSDTAVRLALNHDATVVPVFFNGHNSRLFQWAGRIDARLRTALLPREMIGMRQQTIRISIGGPLPARRLSSFPSQQSATDYLRIRTYALSECSERNEGAEHVPADAQEISGKAGRCRSKHQAIAPCANPGKLRDEVASLSLEYRLLSKGLFDFYCAPANKIPFVLNEIGRLREITFRVAGEGTGKNVDLDEYDPRYLHLFAWNRQQHEIAGAYRLARTSDVIAQYGPEGLYTHSLFNYSSRFLNQLDDSLEMGRSFVAIEYQRCPEVLFGLWQGIGELVWRNPTIRTLFGTVSISRLYSDRARQMIVEYLQRQVFRKDLAELVKPYHPFKKEVKAGFESDLMECLLTTDDVDELINDIEGKNIPILLKHYLRLGAESIAFGVDPHFNNAVDVLIAVDILKTELRRIERFMGRSRAGKYLQIHGIELPNQIRGPVYLAESQEERLDHPVAQSSASST